MPTGYTQAVQDGTITEFRDFAMQCARAFGALITMRDDSIDAPIPDTFPVDTEYYDRSLERARKTLDELDGISREECEERAVAAHKKALAEWQDRESRREIENGRYAAMREKVLAWNPPSDDHLEMKNFMLQQIEKSFDNYKNDPPTPMTGAEWLGEQVRHAQHNIEYQTKARADEIKRVEGRNRWVRLLRESLG